MTFCLFSFSFSILFRRLETVNCISCENCSDDGEQRIVKWREYCKSNPSTILIVHRMPKSNSFKEFFDYFFQQIQNICAWVLIMQKLLVQCMAFVWRFLKVCNFCGCKWFIKVNVYFWVSAFASCLVNVDENCVEDETINCSSSACENSKKGNATRNIWVYFLMPNITTNVNTNELSFFVVALCPQSHRRLLWRLRKSPTSAIFRHLFRLFCLTCSLSFSSTWLCIAFWWRVIALNWNFPFRRFSCEWKETR